MSESPSIVFNNSTPFTLGVELEFQLLDPDTLNLTPAAPGLLRMVPAAGQERIKQEFIQSMIEINTEICATVDDAAAGLSEISLLTEKLARQNNCLLYAASLHPFAKSSEQRITDDARYKRILGDLQLIGRRFITQGLHVHVGMADGDTAIKVCDEIRLYLPIFLALTTSSPFYEGQDTGLCSYRAKLFEALPLAGIPEAFGSWTRYHEIVVMLMQTEIIKQVRDIWWDVRPHPDFGTVEIRICDLPSRFDEIMALVALIQATVVTLSRGQSHRPLNMQVLRSNKWQAARYGLKGQFVDPVAGHRGSLAEATDHLLNMTARAAEKLDSTAYLGPIKRIVHEGTSTDHQRRIFNGTNTFTSIIETMLREFWQ
jgi:carboxylate-amine ligase